ncbi:hypothetical protein Q8W71_08725 [Methylobacterium sp. NEAU 140]|uniref:hypothetical protein n=1 Tax=Methylobacterium sp. NEAU 140 TaxID=3064945 RepID=UPI0027346D7B|nr:hypothetical protein [Methylobacterium sp. NEAU 140]MDP4022704.1 hypothetical protein [Methylobacterium sp. NEAU 140]
MKVRFELLDLDSLVAKGGDFERALTCYVRSTAASERTDTREIAYWREIPVADREGIRYFAFKINGDIVGYAQYRYVLSSKIAILDYLCIDPQQESNAAYFSFIELFCNIIEVSHVVSYITTEINFNIDSETKDEANRYWLRVLELSGFKVAQTKYLLPSLSIEAPLENRLGVLMIRSNEKSPQMSNQTYINIVHSMYFCHYIPWYKPFKKDLSAYQSVLKKELDRVSSSVKKSNFVKLNGSLKHSGLVATEQIEPSLTGKAIYALVLFGLFFILIVSASIAILSVYFGLGSYASILIFLVSLIIFAGLITLFMPSRAETLKSLTRPIWKLFSGL